MREHRGSDGAAGRRRGGSTAGAVGQREAVGEAGHREFGGRGGSGGGGGILVGAAGLRELGRAARARRSGERERIGEETSPPHPHSRLVGLAAASSSPSRRRLPSRAPPPLPHPHPLVLLHADWHPDEDGLT